jgi:hypothetical protein
MERNVRYFRVISDGIYDSLRLQLDAAWGHPAADGGTITCIDPAAVAPHDAQGRVVLAVRSEFCEFSAVSTMLPALLASGAVAEIDEATYRAAMPVME